MEEKLRVLVVDDESPVRRVLIKMLQMIGFEAIGAEDGGSAIQALDAGNIDIVVSDICMPTIDGLTLLRTIAARDLDIPVILITGAPNLETAIPAMEYGACCYVTKPFSFKEIKRVVTHAANLRRMSLLKRQALLLSGFPSTRPPALEESFERALQNLQMAYQPLVDARCGTIFGYEALLRSEEPGLSSPLAVLDAAERLGRLHDLGRVTRARAVAPLVEVPEQGVLFVNIHPEDLLDDELLSPNAPLSASAKHTVLEVTERAALENISDVSARITTLREMGFRIALDDLGAGYAGLNSFAVLQPEFVKLDMALVRGVDTDTMRRKLISSMTNLCRDMNIKVVAEGVESESEKSALIEAGCDLLQGFLIARPGSPFPRVGSTFSPMTPPLPAATTKYIYA